MKLLSYLLGLSCVLSCFPNATAQHIQPTQVRQIDSLFLSFNQGPPVSYGIIYRGQILYKEFGTEAIGCPESGPTLFNLGAMAPHFTAYAILLLEEKELIQFDDEISQYLGEGERGQFRGITIRHLLNHSHGLPDYWVLKSLGGYTEEEPFTSVEASALFSKPLKKIHPTGEKVSFSGTSSYLLTRILETVTGKDLHAFAHEQIFSPLRMENSFFTQPGLRRNPVAYEHVGDVFEPQTIRHYDNGPAGLLTSMEDLLRWFEHLSDPSLPINQKMDEPIRFQGERVAEIPNGQITYGQQFMHDERGINTFWDYGQIGGFASCVFRFPSHDLTIVTLSKNGIPYNGYLGMQISEVLLEGEYQEEDPGEVETPTLPVSEEVKEKFVGTYFDLEYLLFRKIISRNDSLFYYRPDHDDEQALFPINKEELEMRTEYGTYTFRKVDEQLQLQFENTHYTYESLPPIGEKAIQPSELMGTFVCEDWSLVLSIKQGEKGSLRLKTGATEVELHRVDAHRFVSAHPQYSLLSLHINDANECEGVFVSNLGIRDLLFTKLSL